MIEILIAFYVVPVIIIVFAMLHSIFILKDDVTFRTMLQGLLATLIPILNILILLKVAYDLSQEWGFLDRPVINWKKNNNE